MRRFPTRLLQTMTMANSQKPMPTRNTGLSQKPATMHATAAATSPRTIPGASMP